MSLREFVKHPAGLLVQGITGRQGRMETEWMLNSGTRITGGVTPGRGGSSVHGVPVYDSVFEAVEAHGNVVSMIYAPPVAAPDAAIEALEAGVRLVVMSAENVPIHRMSRAMAVARDRGALLVGPNSQGIVAPGDGRIGCPGGLDPSDRFAVGDVGVVSRSGGMASELSGLFRSWGMGTSVQIHIGGAPVVGLRMLAAVKLVCDDPATRRVVVFGEPSGDQEDELADAVAADAIGVPVMAMIGGRFADTLPAALPFGHAPRAGSGATSTVVGKLERLRASGVRVVVDFEMLRRELDPRAMSNTKENQRDRSQE